MQALRWNFDATQSERGPYFGGLLTLPILAQSEHQVLKHHRSVSVLRVFCPHHSPWQRGIPSLDLWASLIRLLVTFSRMAWSAERIKGWISRPHHSPWQRGIPSLDLWASLDQAFGDLIQDGLECRKNEGVDFSPPPFTMAERNSKFRFVGFLDQAFGDLIQDGLECRKNQGVDCSPHHSPWQRGIQV